MDWRRITYALPITPEMEIRIIAPRRMTAEQWDRMLELLAALRPGIVLENGKAP